MAQIVRKAQASIEICQIEKKKHPVYQTLIY